MVEVVIACLIESFAFCCLEKNATDHGKRVKCLKRQFVEFIESFTMGVL